MDKNAIKKYAVWARRELIERVSQKAMQYGILSEEYSDPNADSVNGGLLSAAEKRQRRTLIDRIKEHGFEQVIEEVAYTWFNRFVALRFMEVNGYLPSHVRVFTDEEGKFKPQILTEAIHLELDGLNMDNVYELKNANKEEELFKYLLIVQCNALNKVLPGMFQHIQDYTELLLPDNLLREGSVIERFIAEVEEADFDLSQNGQVEIVGWLYQYYNSEKKDAVFAAMSNKVKVSKENIAAATQLFTPDWIVRYMVENSLGRLWVDGHADTSARSEWKYYLDEAEQTPEVQAQLAEIRADRQNLTPEQIRFIDPCMGSGHILVYAFDVLMQIYLSCGYTERDAAQNIVRKNLWGLDLDKRAYQLAYFAVMMKARQYDRRFFTRGISPNLSHFQDLPTPDYSLLDEPIRSFVKQFENADTYGSLITVQADDEMDKALDEFDGMPGLNLEQMEHLMQLYKILSQRYDVVCTNPPYMAMSNANAKLKDYVNSKYPKSKADLYAVFIEKCSELTKQSGMYSMITQHGWMFIPSFEQLRAKLINHTTINAIHLGARAFDEIAGEVVQTVAFVNSTDNLKSYQGKYSRLVSVNGENEKEKLFLSQKNRYKASHETFCKIPGAPIAYWVSESFINAFKYPKIGEYALSDGQTKTGDNDKYLRLFWEVNKSSIGKSTKWAFIAKGGLFRRWYGNIDYVIDWSETARNHYRKDHVARIAPEYIWFRKGLCWNHITSAEKCAIRLVPDNMLFETAAPTIFFNDDDMLTWLIGFYNSAVSQYFRSVLNPTLSTNVNNMVIQPINFIRKDEINYLVEDNIALSKDDWDSFETSWDFKKHPFIKYITHSPEERTVASSAGSAVYCPIRYAYTMWQFECEDRRAKLKANEEELNRIFIEIYGLQDELTPEVEDKDITVRAADLQRDIRSFISYAVGCMFGRYSIDTEGLAYAGGEFDMSKYNTFMPDKDAIIPICDDEYFEDDIVGRFVKFVETVYGKETLEDNLKFIADSLGGTGTPREVIRNYFISSFYTDHVKTYQKRPIYWLFDSGKKNGFKCLIYMHRYQPDTIARIRTDYAHEQQARYKTAIEEIEKRLDSVSSSERVKLTKKLNKIKAQDEELHTYEEKIHHLADQMISIDLDDGVKHNYALFQDVLAKIK